MMYFIFFIYHEIYHRYLTEKRNQTPFEIHLMKFNKQNKYIMEYYF